MSDSDDKKSSISFNIVTYWLQGRVGDDWQNLESQEQAKEASARFKALRDGGQYDELRLIEATLSAFTKETHYRTVGHYISDESLQAGYQPASDEDLYTSEPDTSEEEEPEGTPDQQPDAVEEDTVQEPTSDTEQAPPKKPEATPWPSGETMDHPIERPDQDKKESVFPDETAETATATAQRDTPATTDESLVKLPEFLDAPHSEEIPAERRKRRILLPALLVIVAGALAAMWLQTPEAKRNDILQRLQQEWQILISRTQEVLSERQETNPPVVLAPEEAEKSSTSTRAPTAAEPPKIDFIPPVEDFEEPEAPPPRVFILPARDTETTAAESTGSAAETVSPPFAEAPSAPEQPAQQPIPDTLHQQRDAQPEPETPAERLIYFSRNLADTVTKGDRSELQNRLNGWPENIPVTQARFPVVDQWGAGDRLLMDHALLNGKWEAAKMLQAHGLRPSPYLVHQAFAAKPPAPYDSIRPFLLTQSLGLNMEWQGTTPLIAALDRGDESLFQTLLDHGANPSRTTSTGKSALSVLRQVGSTRLLAGAITSQFGDAYRELMLGFDWLARRDDIKDSLKDCRPFENGLTACIINKKPPYPKADLAIAQFDDNSDGQLVAIQIDSIPLSGEQDALAIFETVIDRIDAALPDDHIGFSTGQSDDGMNLASGGAAVENTGPYFAYWSDEGRSRPVFVHASLNSINGDNGYYRILIGNPFRSH